jgi:hypothetical protein
MCGTKAYLGTYLPIIITTHLIKHPKRWVSKGWGTEQMLFLKELGGVSIKCMCRTNAIWKEVVIIKCVRTNAIKVSIYLLATTHPTKPFKEVGIKWVVPSIWVVPRTNAIKVSIYLPTSYYPPNTTI